MPFWQVTSNPEVFKVSLRANRSLTYCVISSSACLARAALTSGVATSLFTTSLMEGTVWTTSVAASCSSALATLPESTALAPSISTSIS